jgi:hypothetical protein
MSKISIDAIIARYQAGFGNWAFNVVMAGANRLWSATYPIPKFDEADPSFAYAKFTNNKTNKVYSFGLPLPSDESFMAFTTGNGDIYMAPPLLPEFGREKIVVRSAIDRSDNEVIENFGMRSYEVSLQGILIDVSGHQYPSELVKAVHEMFEAPGTYNVESQVFLDHNITEVFFDKGFKTSFVEGFADTVKFSVNAIATKPAEATYEEK